MAWNRWAFSLPWVTVGMVVAVSFPILGARVTGPRMEHIGRESGRQEGPLDDAARALLRAPALWVTATAMNGMMLGVVWAMGAKSGWVDAIVAPVFGAVVGAFLGSSMSRKRGA